MPFALCHSRGSTQQPNGPLKIRATVPGSPPPERQSPSAASPPPRPPRPPHQPLRPPAVPQQPEPARVVGPPSGRPSHGWPRGLGTFSGACPTARVLCPLPPFISPTSLSTILPSFICLSPLASRGQPFFCFAHCCILSLYNYLQKRQVNRCGVTGPLMGSTWPGHNTSPPLRDAGTEDLPFTGASFSVSEGLFSSNLFGLHDNCVLCSCAHRWYIVRCCFCNKQANWVVCGTRNSKPKKLLLFFASRCVLNGIEILGSQIMEGERCL